MPQWLRLRIVTACLDCQRRSLADPGNRFPAGGFGQIRSDIGMGGNMQPEIIAIGEPMLEFNATKEGSLAEVGLFSVGYGGDTSNFAIAAS